MNFFDLCKKRRATHHFLPGREVTDAQLSQILEAVRYTPSGYNAQPWEFIWIKNPERLKEIQAIAFDQPHITQSSGVIVILGDLDIGRYSQRIVADWLRLGYGNEEQSKALLASMTKERPTEQRTLMALRNAALAGMTLMYAAEDLGIATCPMMGFSQPKLKKLLQIPEDRAMVMMVAMGYVDPKKERPRLARKAVKEMLYFEEFGKITY